jgi:hypothetical protein
MYVDVNGDAPKPVRSRIQYNGNGVFCVDVNNLNRATRNNHNAAAQNPDNWTYNKQTGQYDIGISTQVAAIQSAPNPSPIGIEAEHTTIKTEGTRIAKSTGQTDRRYGHTMNTVGNGADTRGTAAFMLAIDAFFIGYNLWQSFSVLQDLNAIDKQKGLLQQAVKFVDDYMGNINPKYQNANDIGAIVNYVFQGVNDTGNSDITKIGTEILKKAGRYDTNTQQAKPLIQE